VSDTEIDPLQLLTTQELLQLPPVSWLLDSIIPEEGVCGLYGAPGSGKSFIALDWAMCISEGRPWLGVHSCTQAPVIYVAAEGGRGIQQRVRAWMLHHGYKDLPNIFFLLSPLYIRQEGAVESFLFDLEERDIWPGLIVLDTLSRSFGGGEENNSADMGEFVNRLTHLAQGRRMAALVVHHTNAQGSRERGHSAFRGGLDAMYSCDAAKNSDQVIFRVDLANTKQKDGIERAVISMSPVESMKLSLVFEPCDTPEPEKKGPKTPALMRKADMLLVLAIAENGLTWNEWRIGSGMDKNRFSKRLRKMIADGEVIKEHDRYFVMPANKDLAVEDDDEG
jgi:hypothetical protein